eukprot:TRINITY_DN6952_c0_g1_i3.p1 TRINITY_DN6952_c0_g1~~TRINITY_DN6952_c0_g1_i3.p1  ORF type:complete len:397 (+),score=46.00 TRINITY_DN6952_c0_g1_i3:74-1192(+)
MAANSQFTGIHHLDKGGDGGSGEWRPMYVDPHFPHPYPPHYINMFDHDQLLSQPPTPQQKQPQPPLPASLGKGRNLSATSQSSSSTRTKKSSKLQQQQQQSESSSDSSQVEVVLCQGPNTILPKTRSTVDRKYVCNGQPIHRVTFWRHRKQGCPHLIGEASVAAAGATGASAGDVDGLYNSSSISHSSDSFAGRHHAGNQHQKQVKQMSRSLKVAPAPSFSSVGQLDGVVSAAVDEIDHARRASPWFQTPSQFGSTVASSSGEISEDLPSLHQATNYFTSIGDRFLCNVDTSVGLIPRVPPNVASGPGQGSLPSFSLVTDALNLYYSPYRSVEEEDDVSSPVRTTFVHEPNVYDSDRSEPSDFIEDPIHPNM